MHSSRMRITRFSGHPRAGGVCLGEGGVLPRGVSAWGCLPRELYTAPLWTECLTDRCKNITFPQLRLRAVIRSVSKEVLYCDNVAINCTDTVVVYLWCQFSENPPLMSSPGAVWVHRDTVHPLYTHTHWSLIYLLITNSTQQKSSEIKTREVKKEATRRKHCYLRLRQGQWWLEDCR